jgi:hypothetical protein
MATKKPETKEPENAASETALVIPEYMKKFMSQSHQDATSMAMSSISIPRLSYRGKRFRFIENGEEEVVKELTVKVIIVGVEPDPGKFVKTYYEKDYASGDSAPPDCSSSNGINPDAWVGNPQSTRCGQCPKNVFGSATSRSGGKAKACKDGKILWVAKANDPGKYYGLKVPVMSLKNLSEYGKYISKNGYPLALVITELGLEDDAEYPQLTFEHSGFVDEKTAEPIMKINTERPWRATMNVSLIDGPTTAPARIAEPSGPSGKEAPTGGQNPSVADIVKEW